MIVVDASVALAWVLPDSEARHQYGANIAQAGRSGAEELVAPRLLAHECSYRLLKFGRAKRWGEVKIAEYGEVIDYFGMRYFDTTGQLAELIRFAMRHSVQGYDAVYLALAMSLGARLATLDGGLRSAARRAAVEVV